MLRETYDRLGCLRTGVLWPVNVGAATVRAGLRDQGMREIVALSTAAQAFEVCAGEVKTSVSTSQNSTNARSVEWKIDLALVDVINKALGLAAGVAIGYGAAVSGQGSPGAIAAGAAVGLVTAATYSRIAKRSISSERKTEYSFIRDRTKRSLDRDLPGVIQRIREAGLAPVFIVDELDKIADPDVNIANFINRVKHLTTDFGVFCFLTDRAYFDDVLGRIVARPFPPEHTYFSHWLFVLHDTSEILDYLRTAIVGRTPGSAGSAQPGSGAPAPTVTEPGPRTEQPPVTASTVEDLPRTILALYLLHRSKLNTVNLFREIGRCCDEGGHVRATPETISSSFGLRIAATIQLAIHVVSRQAALREQIETDPRFAQTAVDALYILSRAWESGASDVLLTRAAIAEQISARMTRRTAQSPNAAGGETEHSDPGGIGPATGGEALGARDLEFLDEHVSFLVRLLSALRELAGMPEARLGEGLPGDPGQVAPLELTARLIEEVEPGSRRYRFLYDVRGREIRIRDALAADASSVGPTDGSRAAAARMAEAEQFRSSLADLGADLDDFVAAGILPAALHSVAFDAALGRLHVFRRSARPYEDLASDIQLLDILDAFFATHWTAFANVMFLASEVVVVAVNTLGTAVRAIGKCIDLSSSFGPLKDLDHGDASSLLMAVTGRPRGYRASSADAGAAASPHTARARLGELIAELDEYRTFLAERSTSTSEDEHLDEHVRVCWELWLGRLRLYASGSQPVGQSPHFSDIVCVAAGRAPASLFEMDLRRMTVAAWSAICLRGFPELPKDSAPGWSFVAGLWGLGFDRALLQQACDAVRTDEDRSDLLDALVATAPTTRVRGIILVMSEDRPSLGLRTDYRPEEHGQPSNRKIIALRDFELAVYSRALAWLETRGAVIGLSYEE